MADLTVPVEELKVLGFCLFAAACAAVSLAYTLSSFFDLFTRGKTRSKDLEASPCLRDGTDKPQNGKLTRFATFNSLPQRPLKQTPKDVGKPKLAVRSCRCPTDHVADRYARGKSVPVDLP